MEKLGQTSTEHRKAQVEAERTQGWKIDLRPYKQELPLFDEHGSPVRRGTQQVMEESDFDVKDSLAGLCFNRGLMLDAEQMFKAKAIADKVRGANQHVILDEVEMEHVRKGYRMLKGLPERFMEFLSRIKNAEEVKLGEVSGEEQSAEGVTE